MASVRSTGPPQLIVTIIDCQLNLGETGLQKPKFRLICGQLSLAGPGEPKKGDVMTRMNSRLKDAFNAEMTLGKQSFFQRQFETAFHHFERAHVLGQFHVFPHTRVHIWMLLLGLRTGNRKEILGQLLRIPLGMFGSAIGKVPKGNTGGANVELTQRMPIPDDLSQYLDPDK
jgi:uncharacterized protein DUF3703